MNYSEVRNTTIFVFEPIAYDSDMNPSKKDLDYMDVFKRMYRHNSDRFIAIEC